MNHRSEGGMPLAKVISIRVFAEHNKGSQLFRYHARRGCGFTSHEIEKYLESVADQMEKRFPSNEYELVPLGFARFNFVWKGYRKSRPGQGPASA